MSKRKIDSISEFVDRGPLFVIAFLMLVPLPVTVTIGLIVRCLWDGVLFGWSWVERKS